MKSNFSFIIALILLVCFFITNPSHKEHLSSIDTKFTSQNPLLGKIGLGKSADVFTEYQDYFFFSLVVVEKNKEAKKSTLENDLDKVVSFGFLNKVLVRNLDIDI